jgi:hypothetical protein
VYPHPRSAFEQLGNLLSAQAGISRAMKLEAILAETLAPWLDTIEAARASRVTAMEHMEVK